MSTSNFNKFVFGSGDFQMGDDVGSLQSYGALRGATFSEEWEEVKVGTDWPGDTLTRIKNQKARLKAGLLELDLNKLYAARGGLDVLTPVAGTLVEDASQVIASGDWAYYGFIPIEHQNGDGSIITIVSVTASVNGALTAAPDADADYILVKDAQGVYGIAIIDSTTVNTLVQTITIVYDYTPNASIKFTSGGKFTILPKVCRLINTDAAGKKLQLTIYAGKVAKGFEFAFPAANSDDAMLVDFEMLGDLDTSRSAGDQLYEIIDERSYS